jgi:hypothetical protein
VQYPKHLTPTDDEEFLLTSGQRVFVSKATPVFQPWAGDPLDDSYGNKAVVDVQGEPLFAELAILRHLQADGWSGVWVDTFRSRFLDGVDSRATLPSDKAELLNNIYERAGSRNGCFDIFAWSDNRVLFARYCQMLWIAGFEGARLGR